MCQLFCKYIWRLGATWPARRTWRVVLGKQQPHRRHHRCLTFFIWKQVRNVDGGRPSSRPVGCRYNNSESATVWTGSDIWFLASAFIVWLLRILNMIVSIVYYNMEMSQTQSKRAAWCHIRMTTASFKMLVSNQETPFSLYWTTPRSLGFCWRFAAVQYTQ